MLCFSSSRAHTTLICVLLQRHLSLLQFNAHDVYECLRGSRSATRPCTQRSLGLAVYPTASFFNHGCHGACVR